MEGGKKSNSDNVSSPENEKSSGDSAGIGRSYECNFCKRGFTNAQALGGHMNIHRKDKAKAKAKHNNKIIINQDAQNDTTSSNTPTRNNNIIKPGQENLIRYLGHPPHQIPSTTEGYYRAPVGGQVSYQVYLPTTNPSLPIWMQENFDERGRVNANLSLGIGLSPRVEDGDGNNVKEEEVDLELRLGQIHHDLQFKS